MSDTHTIQQSRQLLLQVLEQLERPASTSRTRAVASIVERLERQVPRLELLLPITEKRAQLQHRGTNHSVLHAGIRGDSLPLSVRRRAVLRTMKLLDEVQHTLPDEAPSALHRTAIALAGGVRWFGVRHPLLTTVIILVLLIILLWRQDFSFSTKFGTAEITIRGSRTMMNNGTDRAAVAPEAPTLRTPKSDAVGPWLPAGYPFPSVAEL